MDFQDKMIHNLKRFHDPVEMPGGWTFDHVDTLKQIESYYYGKFTSGKYDSQGYRKFFYNISKPSCDIAEKFTDLDTKDFVFRSTMNGMDHKMWFLQRDFKNWVKDSSFAQTMNATSHRYPKYGHVVLKNTDLGSWDPVYLLNLRMDPAAKSLEDSAFVYELHVMDEEAIRDMEDSWNGDVQVLFDRYNSVFNEFYVYEAYHRKGETWKRQIVAEPLMQSSNNKFQRTAEADINTEETYQPGIVLHEDETDLPYREVKWEDVPGRWLGLGYVEYLADNQIRKNENANMRAKAQYISNLQVFQTTDGNIDHETLIDMEPATIIDVNDAIQPVATENRGASESEVDEQRWDKNAEQKTFSFDVARGETLPSNTPLGVARLTAGMVQSYYNKKKEQLGLFFKDLVVEDILPAFKNERSDRHILKFLSTDKEIGKVRKAFDNHRMRKAIMNYAEKTGIIPSPMSVEMEKLKMDLDSKRRKDLELSVPEGFYDNIKAEVDILITGESLDVEARQQTLQNVLQIIGTNPQVVQDPTIRSVFFKMLELAGVSPVEIGLIEQQAESGRSLQAVLQRFLKSAQAQQSGQPPKQRQAQNTQVTAPASV